MNTTEDPQRLCAWRTAIRATSLDNPDHQRLLWYIQGRSMLPGGLRRLSDEIRARFPDRLSTESMRRLGVHPGRIYSADEVRQVREELQSHHEVADFQLRSDPWWEVYFSPPPKGTPDAYGADVFVRYCQTAAREELAGYLAEICRDEGPFIPPPWLPDLAQCLEEMMAAGDGTMATPTAETAVNRTIRDTLNFTHRQRCLSLIWGDARIGKTHSSRGWVERHVGLARFVEVPASIDILTLLRSVASALGIVGGERLPRCELRAKIFETLRAGGPTLVLDEAHRMWPDGGQDRGLPRRIEWLMEVVNMGTPVALVALPEFFARMAQTANAGWRSEQFMGRLKHAVQLPPLTLDDFRAVTKTLLPEADARGTEVIADYALYSPRRLGGIEGMVLRARYIAQENGRAKVSKNDAILALKQTVAPSDTALEAAMATGAAKAGRRGNQRSVTAAARSIMEAIGASAAPTKEPAIGACGGRPRPVEPGGAGQADGAEEPTVPSRGNPPSAATVQPGRLGGRLKSLPDADALGLQGPCIGDSETQETRAEMASG